MLTLGPLGGSQLCPLLPLLPPQYVTMENCLASLAAPLSVRLLMRELQGGSKVCPNAVTRHAFRGSIRLANKHTQGKPLHYQYRLRVFSFGIVHFYGAQTTRELQNLAGAAQS